MCGCKDDKKCQCDSQERYDGYMANGGGLSAMDDSRDNFLGFGKKAAEKREGKQTASTLDTSSIAHEIDRTSSMPSSAPSSKPKFNLGDTLTKATNATNAGTEFIAGLKGQPAASTDMGGPYPEPESDNTMMYVGIVIVVVILIVIGVVVTKSNK